jgi:hypothetical protein
MRRLKDYIGFIAWQTGFVYAGLWIVTYWGLRTGPMVFNASSVCHIEYTPVLFYWSCAEGTPIAVLAQVIDWALTLTVWTPVYVAAAAVDPDAVGLAGAIVAVHIFGLPAALLVAIRLLQVLSDSVVSLVFRRNADAGELSESARALALVRQAPRPRPPVQPRSTFGLRGPILIEPPTHLIAAPVADSAPAE